jgi:hypothetical protein
MTTTPTASPELPDLDHLEALARAATPGPWAYQEESDAYTHIVRPTHTPGRIVRQYAQDTNGVVEANARFTAGANPAAVLELIALARRAALANQPAPTVPPGDALRDLWIHEDMDDDQTATVLGMGLHAVRKAYSQAREDLRVWTRRALTAEAALAHQPAQEQAENIEADAYMFACDEMERWQKKRAKAGLEIGTEGSLVDGIGWLYAYIEKLEAAQQEPVAAPQQTARIIGDQRWSKEDEMTEGWIAAQQAAAPGPKQWTDKEIADACVQAGLGILECNALLVILKGSAPGTPEAPKKPAHGHRDDYYLLANGRRLGLEPISRVRNMPNWVLAMELFATGSTSAHQICRDAGVDPDSTTIQRAAQLDGGQEGSAT